MPLRSGAAKRFAEAVAGLARQDGSWDRWRRDLSTLAAAAADRRLVLSLESQRIAVARKRELIEGAFGEQVSPGARNLVLVLARRQRLGLLPDVLSWFDQLADRAQGVRRYTVTTAAPLTDEQRARLRLRLGDIIQDYSVRARLEALRDRLN